MQPICLPPEDLDVKKFVGDYKATTAGWGKIDNDGRRSNTLLQVGLPYFNHQTCSEIFPVKSDKQVS